MAITVVLLASIWFGHLEISLGAGLAYFIGLWAFAWDFLSVLSNIKILVGD